MNLLRPTANRRLNELIALLLAVAAALLALALVSYHPGDASLNTVSWRARPHNWAGPVGAYGADLCFQLFGIASFLWVAGLVRLALRWFRGPSRTAAQAAPLAGMICCVIAVGAFLAEIPRQLRWRGSMPLDGAAGHLTAALLQRAFNPTGAYLLTATLFLVGLFLSTDFSFHGFGGWLRPRVAAPLAPLRRSWQAIAGSYGAWRENRAAARAQKRQERSQRTPQPALRADRSERATPVPARPAAAAPPTPPISPRFVPARPAPAKEAPFEDAASRARRELESAGDSAIADERQRPPWEAPGEVVVSDPIERRPAAISPVRAPAAGDYSLPPLSLLQEPGPNSKIDPQELRQLAVRLTEKFQEFSIGGHVTQINPGPVVTTYEFKPEAGVKYSRVTALGEDLCLALEAESVFIERIPGKSTVGIEVPNPHRETIFLREVVESTEFQASKSHLTMALGKDANGRIIVADLAAMPHLLIAGSTGSGKSVALNSMIVSLLYKATPAQVRLILVDPKRLELGLYDGIPHLYTPIITEPKLAANALRNAVREMERRLKLLASRGVRNIGQFNRLFENATPGLFDNVEGEDNQPLPYIVIIIDELADLMMIDGNNVEESITRLAQMARAVGIHLILATQRPSVDVITGLIKANFPARMSFRVATRIDSRTILDAGGAESLLGKGDMLFLPPGTSRFHRIHGAFLAESEIGGVVGFWARQAPPRFDESFLRPVEDASGEAPSGDGAGGDDNDPLFEDAVRVVLEYGKASTSLLQRRLRIGYGRAAHLIDLMYNDGLVGPADGPKPRELLKRPDWLAEVDQSLR